MLPDGRTEKGLRLSGMEGRCLMPRMTKQKKYRLFRFSSDLAETTTCSHAVRGIGKRREPCIATI